ncbi:RNA-directed DNA polymerase [Croceicoccus ponticola]|uniref:RNA-directed DNA polymerase n=1 Tax=Croceicoccus ponticola TaxID=2217664 RepID=A0A437GZJ8_9SPHN|nr:retron St85 family RNA-directed DNA polymerase [Croceicoccus ponticola]RVQ68763.1 RNA-directed DNA polymerase [Croceicoccus ponticola]
MSLLSELIWATGLPQPELMRIITTAPSRYKVYQIPKRTGGWREIAHPARELKALQRLMLNKYLINFPVHQSAMAYVKGRNIGDNAAIHTDSNFFLKLDFERFFPNIKVKDWIRFLKNNNFQPFLSDEIPITSQILFWGSGHRKPQCLSIGAPTSPILSNILLYDLDVELSAHAQAMGVRYSRYADDITISGQTIDQIIAFESLVRQRIRHLASPKLKFNDSKRGVYGRSVKRMVTGLVVTPAGAVSIGRDRKRAISSLVHRFSLGQLDQDQLGYLKGMLGFAKANEPEFLDRLRAKYGDAVIDAATKLHLPPRNRKD